MGPVEYFPELFHNHLMKRGNSVFITHSCMQNNLQCQMYLKLWMISVPVVHPVASSLLSCSRKTAPSLTEWAPES